MVENYPNIPDKYFGEKNRKINYVQHATNKKQRIEEIQTYKHTPLQGTYTYIPIYKVHTYLHTHIRIHISINDNELYNIPGK